MTIAAGHLDRRTLVLAFLGLLAASSILAAIAPNFAVMLLARVLFGISLGGFWTIAVTLGGRLVPKAVMTRATTIITAGISFATVLGVPAGTFIAGFAGWRAPSAWWAAWPCSPAWRNSSCCPGWRRRPPPACASSPTSCATPTRGSDCSPSRSSSLATSPRTPTSPPFSRRTAASRPACSARCCWPTVWPASSATSPAARAWRGTSA
ncbi:MAG: MFS transporter [Verrucomicrobiota bacterium]